MSANLRLYLVAAFGLERAVKNVPEGAWENPSPCEGWSARDVAGHAMGVVNNIAARSGLGEAWDVFATPPGSLAGDDPVSTWIAIRTRFLDAIDRPGALQRPVNSSLGQTTLDGYLGLMVADTTIHTWDIARATGTDERLDPVLIDYVRADLAARDEAAVRGPGRYAAALTGSVADPQTDLLRFAGRHP